MPTFIDHHPRMDMSKMPPEAIEQGKQMLEQVRKGIQAKKTDRFGVTVNNVFVGASNKDLLDHVMELLAPVGRVSSKSMFGGYGLFHEGDMFALISGIGLFFKVDDSNRAAYEQAGSKQYKPAVLSGPCRRAGAHRIIARLGTGIHSSRPLNGWQEEAATIGHTTI